MLPTWVEFTPEEDAILDEIWRRLARERATGVIEPDEPEEPPTKPTPP